MSVSTATTNILYTLRDKLVAALKSVELQLLTNNPALNADTDAALVAVAPKVTDQVGSGVSTTALVPSTVQITCTITGGGATATKATPTVVNGVVTAIALAA